MSIEEDRPNPENIVWDHTLPFQSTQYLKDIGRGDETTRAKITREEIIYRTTHPESRTIDVISNGWKYEPRLAGEYPHAPGLKFHAAVNKISPRSYDEIICNGDSYFSAGKG